jgi:quinol monooxygenase YgiN
MGTLGRGDVFVNTTRVTVYPENRIEFCQTIQSLLAPIRSEKGCLMYSFYQEAGDENSFVLIGEWETRADWDEHLLSNDFAVLLASVMLFGRRPDLDFKLLAYVAGIETVTEARMWCHR